MGGNTGSPILKLRLATVYSNLPPISTAESGDCGTIICAIVERPSRRQRRLSSRRGLALARRTCPSLSAGRALLNDQALPGRQRQHVSAERCGGRVDRFPGALVSKLPIVLEQTNSA